MAGTLVLTTLSDGTNSTSATNAIQGSAKAWVAFNGVPASPTIYSSYNISSVTKSYTGGYTVNFTNAMANTNYSAVIQCQPTVTNAGSDTFVNINVSTTNGFAFIHFEAGVNRDTNYGTAAVFA